MNITDYPYVAGKAILPWLQLQDGLISKVNTNNDVIVHYKATALPHFYFSINKFISIEGNSPVFEISYNPKNEYEILAMRYNSKISDIEKIFDAWLHLIIAYKNLQEQIDSISDTVLKQYEEEFFTEFAFEQDGEEDKVYDLNTQLLIDRFLENIQLKLEEAKTPANEATVNDIQQDVATLREEYTNLTKGQFKDKVVKVFAKIRKGGISLLKQVWDEGKKHVIKQLVEGTLKPENIQKLINTITQ